MSVPANLKYILLSLLFALATINFTRTTLDILKSSQRLEDVNKELTVLGAKKTDLERSINYAKTDEFVEEKARNELNMVKPNEKVFVVQKNDQVATKTEATEQSAVSPVTQDKTYGDNAKLWFDLIF